MPMLISLRDADSADMAAVQEIYAHHVCHGLASFEEQPPDRAEITRRFEAVCALGLPYLTAATESGVVGYAYASPFRSRSAYRYTVEDSVYIAPHAQRIGAGQALLAAVIERCAAAGYRQMVAVIGDSANDASIALHTKLGFARIGVMPAVGFKFGRWVDAVRMQRALGAGATTLPE